MATYYTATTGSDSNPGTIGSPFLTIAKGLSVMGAGDTLYLRAGTYIESIDAQVQTIPIGTSWANAPIIAAYPGETVILRPSSTSWVIGMTQGYIQYVMFKDLVIDATNADYGIKVLNGAHHVRFTGVEVKNSKRQGVHSTLGSGPASGQTFIEFLNMRVHDNGTVANLDHGFYVEVANQLIEGCEVYNNAAFGVHLYRGGSTTLPTNNIVRKNYIHNNNRLGSGRGGIMIAGPSNLVYNNVVANNTEGIELGYGSANNNEVFNNTVYGHSTFGIQVRSGMSGNQLKNNIVYSNGTNIINDGSGTVQSNNLTTDPSFVNAAGADFHLQAGSAAIDAGTPLVADVPDDFDGGIRPFGSAYDIGAYEYNSVIPPETIPAAPTNLVALTISSSRIDLTWTDNSDNEAHFKIELSTNGTTFSEITQTDPNTVSFSSVGLAHSTLYYYRARASNSAGNSSYSNTATATTLASFPDIRETQIAREVAIEPSNTAAQVAQEYLDVMVMPDGGVLFSQQCIEVLNNLPTLIRLDGVLSMSGSVTLGITKNDFFKIRKKKLIYLVTLTLRYASGSTVLTENIYLSNHAFNTYANETPPNTEFIAVLRDADIPSFKQELSEALYGISIPSFGRLVINNADGQFDDKLPPNRVWEGGTIVVKLTGDRSEIALNLATTIFTGTLGKLTYSDNTISVEVFSRAIELQKKNVPDAKFTGPNDEEVVSPVAYGYVNNISPFLKDPVNLTYKVAGHAINAITNVYDIGVALTSGSQWTNDLANGEFTLNQPAVGQITCDVQGKSILGSFSANRADFIYDLITTYGGLTIDDVDGASLTSARISMAGDSGYYINSDSPILSVVEDLLQAVLGYLYFSRLGKAIIGKFEIPDAGTIVALELDSAEIFPQGNATSDSGATGDVIVASQVDRLFSKIIMGYDHNFTIQTEDSLGHAPPVDETTASGRARRAWLSKQSLRIEASNTGPTTGRNLYKTAEEMKEPIETWFINQSDARNAANYWLEVYGVQRYLVAIQCTAAPLQTSLHNIIVITYFVKDENSGDTKTLTRWFNGRKMRSVAYEENYGDNLVNLLLFI